jgi:mannose-6-phosphate isomerase-like protein (cupin superfamily)
MKSPCGWEEPGQRPEFDEYSLVLSGILRVVTQSEILEIGSNQAVFAPRGEWVHYSTPYPEGAEYISICLPAFSPDTVHRDE